MNITDEQIAEIVPAFEIFCKTVGISKELLSGFYKKDGYKDATINALWVGFAAGRISLDAERKALAIRVERLEDAIHKINQWTEAYPPQAALPEPDFKRAADVLEAAGMTVDALSASNVHYIVTKLKNFGDSLISKPTKNTP
jgi:hypothetical protein